MENRNHIHIPSIPDIPSTVPEFMTTDEVAIYLRLKRQTLEAWRMRGQGPTFIKLGRSVVYRRAVIERFMMEQERQSTSEYTSGTSEI